MVRGAGAMEKPSLPRPMGGDTWRNFALPPTTHIDNQGVGPLEKISAHPDSLGEWGWDNAATAPPPLPTHTHAHTHTP